MKILHLEDSVQDAELIGELLAEEWSGCEIDVVDSRAAFARQLGQNYDVILSDFSLPSFDGLEALKLAKELAPGKPFIFVSGSIGEERAIEAVRNGAFDYVIKDRMKRLTTAIRRALSEMSESARRRAAEEAHVRLVSILESSPAMVAIMGVDGRLSYLNRAGRRMIGLPEDRDASAIVLNDLHPPDAAARFANEAVAGAIRSGSWLGESSLLTLDGRRLPVSELVLAHRGPDGNLEYISTVIHDLTEKKKLEEQFLRSQRVETIGMLAAGIAHDLNNVLAPIAMSAPVLRQRATNPSDIKLLEALEKSAERGTGLVRQILTFARGTGGELGPMQIKNLAREVINVIEETFPKDIDFEHRIPSDLWLIHAHPTHIHQVLLNLCVNARDAMPNGGTLSLSAQNVVLTEGMCDLLPAFVPGNYVLVEIGDTGTGMSPEVLARIWEPFFTTKTADQGTGLGLSTVRGIVDNHKGFIDLKTEVGKGTTFAVYLPAVKE